MSTLDEERVAATGPARPDVPPGESRYASDPQFTAALKASIGVAAASWHLVTALRKLAVAEGRSLLLVTVPLLFVSTLALMMLGLAMWLCLVALIGWALLLATGSLSLALGLLVVIHVVLLGCVGLVLIVGVRQATLPRARAELRKISRSLRRDLHRIIDPPARDGSAPASGGPNRGDGS